MKNILKPNLDSRPKFSFFSALPKETLTATVLAFSGETPFPTTMNHQPCFIIFFINFPIPNKCSLHLPRASHYKINSAYKKKHKISHPWFSPMLLRVGRDPNYLQAHTFFGSLTATRNGKSLIGVEMVLIYKHVGFYLLFIYSLFSRIRTPY